MCVFTCVFFFKQKTAYELRISDWSSDVCSSDLTFYSRAACRCPLWFHGRVGTLQGAIRLGRLIRATVRRNPGLSRCRCRIDGGTKLVDVAEIDAELAQSWTRGLPPESSSGRDGGALAARSEEHTSELQSLMRISYAVFCLTKKNIKHI